ncbi:hypothetical protein [Thermofilum pendens]|uniref:Uncharacterized protein n=1 Tax=Thermofilum pendens (strain DSM 2475 / Hrk 5) TaxID=368408 RepID=A1RWY7_THEPD|nr:hypothetical protein [Thermofilum pendens]ABL77717.1 hypothetical protein Tpen_0308 [Thermofilum pendens Hrk 5]
MKVVVKVREEQVDLDVDVDEPEYLLDASDKALRGLSRAVIELAITRDLAVLIDAVRRVAAEVSASKIECKFVEQASPDLDYELELECTLE